MKIVTSLLLFYILSISFLAAQNPDRHCGTDAYLQNKLQNNPSLAHLMAAEEAAGQKRLADQQLNARFRADEIYTIPVVVHIVWYDESENLSDAQIHSQIAVLNEDFRQKNLNQAQLPAEFKAIAADIGFEFCLAKIDPEGNPTTGITRTQTTVENVGNNAKKGFGNESFIYRTALGGKDAWDTERYLNIWVANTGGAYLGFATIPTVPDLQVFEKGIIMDPKNFGTTCNMPYHLGRVATHEVGHYFNLSHIWGAAASCLGDDGVDDTPPQEKPYRGCPSYPSFSCNSSDMFMNFMDYTYDECISAFTEGQKARMLDALFTYHPGLLESNSCQTKPVPEKEQLIVFPNPAMGNWLRLRLDVKQEDVVEVRLFNMLGIMLSHSQHRSGNIPPLDITDLPTGIYVVDVVVGGNNFATKVLVHP